MSTSQRRISVRLPRGFFKLGRAQVRLEESNYSLIPNLIFTTLLYFSNRGQSKIKRRAYRTSFFAHIYTPTMLTIIGDVRHRLSIAGILVLTISTTRRYLSLLFIRHGISLIDDLFRPYRVATRHFSPHGHVTPLKRRRIARGDYLLEFRMLIVKLVRRLFQHRQYRPS